MFKRFLPYYQPYKAIVLLTVVGSLLTAGLDLVFPLLVRHILDAVLPAGELTALFLWAGILLALYGAGYVLSYAISYQGHVMSARIENDMRRDMFKHIESLTFRYFDNSKTGQLLSRIVGDLAEIGELAFRGPSDVIVCSITMLGTIAILFAMQWQLALLVSALLLLKAHNTVAVGQQMKASFRENRARVGDISAQVEDSIAGIRLVKSFTNETYELEKFMETSHALLAVRKRSYRILARFLSGMNFFTNFTNATTLLAGGLLISQGKLTISEFVAFLLYVGVFMKPVLRLTVLSEVYQRGMAGFHRFCEIMDERPEFVDAPDAADCKALRGDIAFHDVSFSYDNRSKVISHVDLQIWAGEAVAFVGPTGAGKSTLCNLIPRFYEIQSGRLTIDGIDIRQVTQQSLRKNIGIVQQDVFLFSDSVRANIAYGRVGASEAEIVAAAKLANAHEFIEKLPDGYDTFIGERGVKLSGGQKQRIAIARIFLKNPPILILDEATSALDNETEQKIQAALIELAKNRTTLMIAHRLATIRRADRILVVTEEGITEEGDHDALMARQGLYYKLYQAQFKSQL